MEKPIRRLILVLCSILLLQACSATGELGGDSEARVYNRNFDEMANIVERAIRGSSLGIVHTREAPGRNEIVYIFNREVFLGNERIQEHEGEAVIRETDDGKIQVRVINPEYHFSVPDENRENYQRMLFNRIDDLL